MLSAQAGNTLALKTYERFGFKPYAHDLLKLIGDAAPSGQPPSSS